MNPSPCHVYALPAPAKAQDPIGPPSQNRVSRRVHSLSKRIASQGLPKNSFSLTPDFFKVLPVTPEWSGTDSRLFLRSPIEMRAMLEKKEEEVRSLEFKANYYVNKCNDLGIQLAAAIGAFESQTEQNTEDQNYLARTLDLIREENARLAVMVSHYTQREREHRSTAERLDFYTRKEKADQQMQAIASLIWCEPSEPPADICTSKEGAQLIEEASRSIWANPDAQLMEASRRIWAGEKRKAATDARWIPGMSKPCWTTPETLDTTPAAKHC